MISFICGLLTHAIKCVSLYILVMFYLHVNVLTNLYHYCGGPKSPFQQFLSIRNQISALSHCRLSRTFGFEMAFMDRDL